VAPQTSQDSQCDEEHGEHGQSQDNASGHIVDGKTGEGVHHQNHQQSAGLEEAEHGDQDVSGTVAPVRQPFAVARLESQEAQSHSGKGGHQAELQVEGLSKLPGMKFKLLKC